MAIAVVFAVPFLVAVPTIVPCSMVSPSVVPTSVGIVTLFPTLSWIALFDGRSVACRAITCIQSENHLTDTERKYKSYYETHFSDHKVILPG
jgi:hypothetical protein